MSSYDDDIFGLLGIALDYKARVAKVQKIVEKIMAKISLTKIDEARKMALSLVDIWSHMKDARGLVSASKEEQKYAEYVSPELEQKMDAMKIFAAGGDASVLSSSVAADNAVSADQAATATMNDISRPGDNYDYQPGVNMVTGPLYYPSSDVIVERRRPNVIVERRPGRTIIEREGFRPGYRAGRPMTAVRPSFARPAIASRPPLHPNARLGSLDDIADEVMGSMDESCGCDGYGVLRIDSADFHTPGLNPDMAINRDDLFDDGKLAQAVFGAGHRSRFGGDSEPKAVSQDEDTKTSKDFSIDSLSKALANADAILSGRPTADDHKAVKEMIDTAITKESLVDSMGRLVIDSNNFHTPGLDRDIAVNRDDLFENGALVAESFGAGHRSWGSMEMEDAIRYGAAEILDSQIADVNKQIAKLVSQYNEARAAGTKIKGGASKGQYLADTLLGKIKALQSKIAALNTDKAAMAHEQNIDLSSSDVLVSAPSPKPSKGGRAPLPDDSAEPIEDMDKS